MAHDEAKLPNRRTLLQAGALATASALGASSTLSTQDTASKPMELPRRPLGKTGIDITILDQGTGKGPDVDRLLRYGFCAVFGRTTPLKRTIPKVLSRSGLPRILPFGSRIFLVTKDAPKTPSQLLGMLDKRLAALGTDVCRPIFHS